jgi:spore coat polysaccharide biosynthesis predicted glycosyltransferase SpsG
VDHDVRFLLRQCDDFAVDACRERGFEFRLETDLLEDLAAFGAATDRKVVVNDVLDTNATDLALQRAAGYRVVCIEDLGAGLRLADLVINALYHPPDSPVSASAMWGAKWAPLRWEFLNLPPRRTTEHGRRVLVTLGGTDPSRLAPRLAMAFAETDLDVTFVLGAAVPHVLVEGITVKSNISSMASEMLAADVVVTSAGRTVYEAAATGTPVVVVAQNAREAAHSHLTPDTGVVFLGLGSLVDENAVVAVTNRLLSNPGLRSEISARLRASIDSHGAERIADQIDLILRGAHG